MRKYPKINKDKPAFVVIFNNEVFKESTQRKGSKVDVRSIRSLERFEGIKIHKYDLENLKAVEIIGAFKILAKHDVTTEYLDEAEIEGAWKLHCKPDHSLASSSAKDKRDGLKDIPPISFKDYSCFMAFIMSHGDKNGITGTDGGTVEISELSSYISKCEGLKDKPKVFFIQACRGNKKDVIMNDQMGDTTFPAHTDGTYIVQSLIHSYI